MISVDEDFERYLTKDERERIAAEDFAGTDRSYPCDTQAHLDAAAKLLGHAPEDEQAHIKARIKSIAKRKGLKLPDSWEDGSEERMAGNEAEQPTNFSFYAPFVRVDGEQKDKREVIGKATRGTPIDTYGTIITYEGSKKAFSRAMRIPVREMHQAKAVGKGLEWWGSDKDEDIFLHSYTSRGAEDTWTKVQEDILVGYSIKGANAKYGTIQRDGKTIPAIVDYDLVEVSLVDNPSCPGCDIAIMRADGIEQDVLASDEELAEVFQRAETDEQTAPPTPEPQPSEIERAGARISSESRDTLHSMRDQAMSLCGCDDCKTMMQPDDGDGDVDTIDRVTRAVDAAMSPVYARMQAYLGEFARKQTETAQLQQATASLASALSDLRSEVQQFARADSLDKVVANLESLKGEIERVGKLPMPGGPHTGRGADKTLATAGPAQHVSQEQTPDILRDLANRGVELSTAQRTQLVATSLKRLY